MCQSSSARGWGKSQPAFARPLGGKPVGMCRTVRGGVVKPAGNCQTKSTRERKESTSAGARPEGCGGRGKQSAHARPYGAHLFDLIEKPSRANGPRTTRRVCPATPGEAGGARRATRPPQQQATHAAPTTRAAPEHQQPNKHQQHKQGKQQRPHTRHQQHPPHKQHLQRLLAAGGEEKAVRDSSRGAIKDT